MLLAIATAAQAQFGGGTGEHYDPYIISTTDHLTELANNVNNGITSYEDTFFRLDADLDFTGKTYTPIGTSSNPFRGNFDGNYKSINNVTLVTNNIYIGLFRYLETPARVDRLFLGGHSRIEGYTAVGGIAGVTYGGVINGCEVGADVVVAARTNPMGHTGYIGGIVGYARGGSFIINCVSRATVTHNGTNCNGIGGIVGYTEKTLTVSGCVSFSTIVGTNGVGGIIGEVGAGTPEVTNCLYTNFTGGGIEGADSDGAAYMGRISFGDGFSEAAVVSGVSFQDGDTPYYKSGTTVELRLTGASQGWAYHFFGNGTPLSPDGNDRYSVTMPTHADLLVTATKGKRDIAYEPWVSVSIPSQEYTGSPLTPAVTVTDSKDGAPVTLTEGVHYTVTLPDGLTDYGHYDITISGIGTFEGQTTARFTITAPQGTEDNPFVISTTDEMDAFAAAVNIGLMPEGQYIVLDADLDYTGKTYTPVGAPNNPFKGNFNGNGHAISNVVINKTNDGFLGLFGIVEGGTVADLVLGTGSSITGSTSVGGIVGLVYGGTVAGCFVSENVAISGEGEIGGIVGSNLGGTVEGCLVSENVTVTASLTDVGGIVGIVDGGTIDYCVNNSSVSGDNYVGGITGYVYTTATLSNNLNLGAVSRNDGVLGAGGIVGYRKDGTFVNNLWAGNCTVGGVGNADEDGARRGWVVSAADGIFVQQMPDEDFNFTGITHDGIIYLGAGQTGYFMVGRIDGSAGNFAASAGTLTPVSSAVFTENYYALAMPTQGQDVVISSTDISLAVPGYGTSENGGWRFIASPVAGSIEAEAVGNIFLWNYDLYRFNQSETLEWRNHDIEPFELENGKGYLYASETDITLFFSGSYNQATEPVEVPLVYDANASFAGWNLVGNPFPVAAYANRSYYTMNADGTGIEPNAVSSATAIPVCTGLMVKAETTGETVTFSRTAQQSTGNGGMIQIAVAQADTRGNAIQDKAIVSFNVGDRLEKFVFGETDAKIYIPQGGKDYAVATVGRDAPWHVSTTDEIPINFKAAKNGTYTLIFDTQNLDLDYLHLIDNLTGEDIDLLSSVGASTGSAAYTFEAKTTDYASRFRLVFSTPADETSANRTFAYYADGEIRLVETCHGASLHVVDVMGRVIVSTGGHTRCVPTAGMTPGVYVLRLIDGENVRTQKMVIE